MAGLTMTAAATEQTRTRPADTGDKVWHLYCIGYHQRIIGQERALCGAKRNRPHDGSLFISQAEQQGYCVVCVDIAKHQGTICPPCKKGKK